MPSYFTLEFDTTGPAIEMISPAYTGKFFDTELKVTASEPLSSYQDFYVVDGNGVKHPLIFTQSPTKKEFTGKYNFNDCSIGIATFYAQVKDEVGNLSNLASKAINIVSSRAAGMKVSISERTFGVAPVERKFGVRTELK